MAHFNIVVLPLFLILSSVFRFHLLLPAFLCLSFTAQSSLAPSNENLNLFFHSRSDDESSFPISTISPGDDVSFLQPPAPVAKQKESTLISLVAADDQQSSPTSVAHSFMLVNDKKKKKEEKSNGIDFGVSSQMLTQIESRDKESDNSMKSSSDETNWPAISHSPVLPPSPEQHIHSATHRNGHRVPLTSPVGLLYCFIAVVLVIFAGFASGLTVGLMSLDPVQLKVLEAEGTAEQKAR